jgi:hypothetical protein
MSALWKMGAEAVDQLVVYVRTNPRNTRGWVYAVELLGDSRDRRAIDVLREASRIDDLKQPSVLSALGKCGG